MHIPSKARTDVSYEDRLLVTADVFRHIVDHAVEGGSFRYLIYERLGFDLDAYTPLYLAGGMEISNNFVLAQVDDHETLPESLKVLESLANAAPMDPHETLRRTDGEPISMPSLLRSQLFAAFHTACDMAQTNEMLRQANIRLAEQHEALEKEVAMLRAHVSGK